MNLISMKFLFCSLYTDWLMHLLAPQSIQRFSDRNTSPRADPCLFIMLTYRCLCRKRYEHFCETGHSFLCSYVILCGWLARMFWVGRATLEHAHFVLCCCSSFGACVCALLLMCWLIFVVTVWVKNWGKLQSYSHPHYLTGCTHVSNFTGSIAFPPTDTNQALRLCLGTKMTGAEFGAVSALSINHDCSRLLCGFAKGQVLFI